MSKRVFVLRSHCKTCSVTWHIYPLAFIQLLHIEVTHPVLIIYSDIYSFRLSNFQRLRKRIHECISNSYCFSLDLWIKSPQCIKETGWTLVINIHSSDVSLQSGLVGSNPPRRPIWGSHSQCFLQDLFLTQPRRHHRREIQSRLCPLLIRLLICSHRKWMRGGITG